MKYFYGFLFGIVGVLSSCGRTTLDTSSEIKWDDGHFDVKKIKNAIEHIRRQVSYRPINDTKPTNETKISPDPIPENIEKNFNSIKKYLFGDKPSISLSACEEIDCDAHGPAYTDVSIPRIVIDPKSIFFSTKEYSTYISFILAHEISHYLAELSIDHSDTAKSPNGFESLLRNGSPFQKFSIKDQLSIGGQAHAEVDAFAIVVLRDMSLSTEQVLDLLTKLAKESEGNIKKLRETLKDDSLVNPDEIRLQEIKRFLKAI